jgi:hypothetical protein
MVVHLPARPFPMIRSGLSDHRDPAYCRGKSWEAVMANLVVLVLIVIAFHRLLRRLPGSRVRHPL